MKTAISLFSSSGIGDIAFKRQGIDVLVANELLEERCNVFKTNFPETIMIQGSIWDREDEIISTTEKKLNGRKLNFALVTPPCQGMSKNGRGKLLSEIKKGNRPKVDERNLLIIPALNILKKLKPESIIFENVSEMVNTVIPYKGEMIDILSLIKNQLEDYFLEANIINFADFGIPQNRLRLLTLAIKNDSKLGATKEKSSIFPKQTHSKEGDMFLKRWVTVRDKIGNIEPLDAKSKLKSSKHDLHFVSRLDDKKYHWISCTPEGSSAFNNQCIKCGYKENPVHISRRDETGTNRPSNETPLFCLKCNEILPRPHVDGKEGKRIMKGFTSAYKRMKWDEPASAITTNFPYVSSDNKVHPSQNRALSVMEAMILQDIKNDEFKFFVVDKKTTFLTIRESIGESVPPTIIEIFIKKLLKR